jgi:hypothetical protein
MASSATMTDEQREVSFRLQLGYPDDDGTTHHDGVMRRATASDEVLPRGDPRVVQNPSYFDVVVLSRVVTRLGTLPVINTKVIEGLFSADYNFLMDLYRRFNAADGAHVTCPHCAQRYALEATTVD